MDLTNSDDTKAQKIKDLRGRLDKLNRASVKKTPAAASTPRDDLRRSLQRRKQARATADASHPLPGAVPTMDPILYRRDLPRTQPAYAAAAQPSVTVILSDAATGVEVVDQRGKAYHVKTAVAGLEDVAHVDKAFEAKMVGAEGALHERLRRQHDSASYSVSDFLFVDIETTGLSSSPLFLIGIMLWEDTGLIVHQFLARDYAEEAAVISLFVKASEGRSVIVTFNGKTFDYPYIRNRAAANGVPIPPPLPHFDLLHECRRLWKHTLPDCKLQTLERYVCNRTRSGDIPGSQIPQAYHDYVRTGNAWQIVEILKHNMIDLVTLGELMAKFPD
jgi:uncharacterized protein YprB with RNaseH-like and TPR domain